jgi:putative thiazole/oxazole-modified microcin (TOMM)-like peptide
MGVTIRMTVQKGTVMADTIGTLSGEDRSKFARIVARAWSDEQTRGRYENDPHAVLSEAGIDYPAGAPVPYLPAKPEGEFNVEMLELVAGDGVIIDPSDPNFSCAGSASSVSSLACPCGTAFTASTFGCAG